MLDGEGQILVVIGGGIDEAAVPDQLRCEGQQLRIPAGLVDPAFEMPLGIAASDDRAVAAEDQDGR